MVLGGTLRRELLRVKMPRPLVVVHSGNKTIGLLGYCSTRVETSTIWAPGAGCVAGEAKARRMAWSREMRSTWRVLG